MSGFFCMGWWVFIKSESISPRPRVVTSKPSECSHSTWRRTLGSRAVSEYEITSAFFKKNYVHQVYWALRNRSSDQSHQRTKLKRGGTSRRDEN